MVPDFVTKWVWKLFYSLLVGVDFSSLVVGWILLNTLGSESKQVRHILSLRSLRSRRGCQTMHKSKPKNPNTHTQTHTQKPPNFFSLKHYRIYYWWPFNPKYFVTYFLRIGVFPYISTTQLLFLNIYIIAQFYLIYYLYSKFISWSYVFIPSPPPLLLAKYRT